MGGSVSVENPRNGGGFSRRGRGRGAGRVSAGNLGGRGAKYFFSGLKRPPSSDLFASPFCIGMVVAFPEEVDKVPPRWDIPLGGTWFWLTGRSRDDSLPVALAQLREPFLPVDKLEDEEKVLAPVASYGLELWTMTFLRPDC